MSDYTHILPADAQRVLSSCERRHDRPYDEAAIMIGDGVRLRVRTLYGSDGVPMTETSSTTATGATARARTKRMGRWFDGYEKA